MLLQREAPALGSCLMPVQREAPALGRPAAEAPMQTARAAVGVVPTLRAAEQFAAAEVIVFYFWNHDWSPDRYAQVDAFLAHGGGLALFHSACISDKEPEKLAERIGLAAQPGPTQYRHTAVLLNFVGPTNDAVTRGFKQLDLLDEPYWPLFGDTNRIEVLAAADVDGQSRPLVWTFQKGKGRVFASVMGHYTWTLEDPLFRVLALRGVAWAAGQRVERLEASN